MIDLNSSEKTRKELTISFFNAIGIEGDFQFIIDRTSMSIELAADLSINRTIENCSGTYTELQDKLRYENNLGSNIKVILNRTGNSVAFVHSPDWKVKKHKVEPNFSIMKTEMSYSYYWICERVQEDDILEINNRLVYAYDGDLSGLNPYEPQFIPGFMHHPDGHIEKTIHNYISYWVNSSSFNTKRQSTPILKASLPPIPRWTYTEVIDEMLESLSSECSPYVPYNTCKRDHLIRVAEIYIRRGYPVGRTVRLCIHINRHAKFCVDEDEIHLMCYYKQGEFDNKISDIKCTDHSRQLFSKQSASVSYFLDTPPPTQRWLFNNCLPVGKVALMVARGGTGKSQLSIQMAISVATGTAFISTWPIVEFGPAIMLCAEDDEDEIHRRLLKAANEMALLAADPACFYERLRSNLFIKSVTGVNVQLTSMELSKEISPTDNVEKLLHTVREIKDVKLITLDPVSRFRGGQENSAEDTTRFVEVMERIAKETGATVLSIHHVNKASGSSGEQMQEASRGSSALTDGVRWQANLAAMTSAEAKEYGVNEEDRPYYLSLSITKNNYAPPQPKQILKRGSGGMLHHATLTSTKHQKAEDMLGKVAELVGSEAKRGALYSKTGFEVRFGGLDGQLKIGKVALRKLLDEALTSGKLLLHCRKLAMPGHTVPYAKVTLPNS